MTRTVTHEPGRFLVTEDPRDVIGRILGMLVSNLDRAELEAALAPDGDGYGLDTIGGVVRVEHRDDLPERGTRIPRSIPKPPSYGRWCATSTAAGAGW